MDRKEKKKFCGDNQNKTNDESETDISEFSFANLQSA